MSTSIVTNVSSLIARENLRVNNEFQGRTINRLTSGLRINNSSDDAAGLAVANRFRSDITELTQGVRNANDGLSTLQIVDGGLNNVSKILDRLKTLATQSASNTFTGDRTTLNNEYRELLGEINRQAANVGLVSGGVNNTAISVYVGGGSSQANAKVAIDLSGVSNRVDSGSLGVGGTQVVNGGVTTGTVNLDTAGPFAAAGSQSIAFQLYDSGLGTVVTKNVTVDGGATGVNAEQVLTQLNDQLNTYGITASKGTDGILQLSSSRAFSALAGTATAGTAFATAAAEVTNSSNYRFELAAYASAGDAQTITVQNAQGAVTVNIASSADATAVKTALNAAVSSLGIEVVGYSGTDGISIQSSTAFSITVNEAATGAGINGTSTGALTVTAGDTSATATGNALAAISSIDAAITSLGRIQGKVGTAQNKLQYSINLAQSQISSFSAAESRIRDADIALEASNLTKAQVVQQASLAALAQANSAPQAVLALLRG
ncbi:MAG: flagellin [Bryobacterales bacterium]|nr:flagellin [Bryobacterales bacterium]